MENGKHLFCNIVNCLNDKYVITYFTDEKALIKKDGYFFSRWKVIYMTCDSNKVYIKKKVNEKPF
jgi:hypothetical protein